MSDDAYDRGHLAGEINARLADHDRHFAAINGSLADIARELHKQTLALQKLGDQAVARDATVITTAAALKSADEQRRAAAEQSWSPWTKLFAVIGAVVALISAVVAAVSLGLIG